MMDHSKPCTIQDENEATLLEWLRCYPVMRQPKQARMFLGSIQWTQAELAAVYHAGLTHVALELGYRDPLEAHSLPTLSSIAPVLTYNYSISDTVAAEVLPCA